MNTWFARAGAVLGVLALTGSIALAGPPKASKKAAKSSTAKTAVVTCPVCKMPLSKTETKTDTVAVRLKKGGPVMYCCSKCKMPASALVKKSSKKTTTTKKHASASTKKGHKS